MRVDLTTITHDLPVHVTSVSAIDMEPDLVEGIAAATAAIDDEPGSLRLTGAPPAEWMTSVDHVIDAARGVIVRVHRVTDAPTDRTRPCLFSIHGGGYVFGDRSMDDALHARLCRELDLVGVAVEYRLAPDCPYPGPLQDCLDALEWVIEHADEFGIDRDRIGIYGASAGGGLAAALALAWRDARAHPILFQALMAPMIDDRRITPSSRLDGLAVWPREANEAGWRAYLGERFGADELPTYAAAARAQNLAGLPPTYVAVGALDGFRDEDIDYATRLAQAGVATELHVYPGGPHGYGLVPSADVSRRSSRDLTDWLRRQFTR